MVEKVFLVIAIRLENFSLEGLRREKKRLREKIIEEIEIGCWLPNGHRLLLFDLKLPAAFTWFLNFLDFKINFYYYFFQYFPFLLNRFFF